MSYNSDPIAYTLFMTATVTLFTLLSITTISSIFLWTLSWLGSAPEKRKVTEAEISAMGIFKLLAHVFIFVSWFSPYTNYAANGAYKSSLVTAICAILFAMNVVEVLTSWITKRLFTKDVRFALHFVNSLCFFGFCLLSGVYIYGYSNMTPGLTPAINQNNLNYVILMITLILVGMSNGVDYALYTRERQQREKDLAFQPLVTSATKIIPMAMKIDAEKVNSMKNDFVQIGDDVHSLKHANTMVIHQAVNTVNKLKHPEITPDDFQIRGNVDIDQPNLYVIANSENTAILDSVMAYRHDALEQNPELNQIGIKVAVQNFDLLKKYSSTMYYDFLHDNVGGIGYYGIDNGFCSWFYLPQLRLWAFAFAMCAFYMLLERFTLNGAMTFFITTVPALAMAYNSKVGYFWSYFRYTTLYGLALIVNIKNIGFSDTSAYIFSDGNWGSQGNNLATSGTGYQNSSIIVGAESFNTMTSDYFFTPRFFVWLSFFLAIVDFGFVIAIGCDIFGLFRMCGIKENSVVINTIAEKASKDEIEPFNETAKINTNMRIRKSISTR